MKRKSLFKQVITLFASYSLLLSCAQNLDDHCSACTNTQPTTKTAISTSVDTEADLETKIIGEDASADTNTTTETLQELLKVDDNDGANYEPIIRANDFVGQVTHPYFNLSSGQKWSYQEETLDGEIEETEVDVINAEKMILGITMSVVRERVWEDSELAEEKKQWYAQDHHGNVWLFGEHVDQYEDEEIISHEGSWEAGINNAKPGMILTANPQVGDEYRVAFVVGEVEDIREVLGITEVISTNLGNYKNCLKLKEVSALEPKEVTYLLFCQEVGNLVSEESIEGDTSIKTLTNIE